MILTVEVEYYTQTYFLLHLGMPGRDDVEESSSSLGYSPSDYSDPSKGFQEETTVPDLRASQLASRDGGAIDTLAELGRAHSSDWAEGSLAKCERLPR